MDNNNRGQDSLPSLVPFVGNSGTATVMENASTVLARSFIEHRGGAIHPAFGEQSAFDPITSQYQPSSISLCESNALEETLKRCHIEMAHQTDLDFDPLQCTWKDVLRELERATDAASDSEARGRKLYQRIWRSMGTRGADIVIPGLAALPDKLSILQGGLAVIFSIARKRAQDRQKILRAFGDIPTVIMMATDKAENLPRDHPRSENLRGAIRDFQQTLLDALAALINILNPGTLVKKSLVVFKSVDVDDLLDTVRNASDRVRACAEGLMDSLVVSTNRTIHESFETTQNIHKIAEHTEVEVGELRGKVDEMLKGQENIQLSLDLISGKNGLLHFLEEYLESVQFKEPKPQKGPQPVPESATTLTASQLHHLMNIDHLSAVRTEAHIVQRSHSMDQDAISHATSMFHALEVQDLLRVQRSSLVLVNCQMDRSRLAKISPMTYVCATLTQALRAARSNVVLTFFCGQHSASIDDLAGPQGLMRSLIAHLVLALVQTNAINEFEQVWFMDVDGNTAQLGFEDVCHIFYRLVETVPSGITLYCIVDGISWYEQAQWEQDYARMMECFGRIISNEGKCATFKLLLTSPTRSHWLSSILTQDQQVSLRNARGN